MAATTKPKVKQVSEKNEIIRSLEGLDYVKNPFVYSQIRGDFTLMQQKVMISVIGCLQSKIADNLVEGRGIVGPIVSSSNPEFRIDLQDLQLGTYQYKDLDVACDTLRNMAVSFTYKEGEQTRYKRMSIFTAYDIPKADTRSGGQRRSGYIKMTMNKDAVDYLFNSSNQYIEHISNIALISRSPRTPRLYLFLSAFRKTTKERIVSYDAVKEFLGFVDYNAEHTKVKEDRAPKYSLFKRDVIDPAQRELKKLCMNGDVEFYFEYEPVYEQRKKRGVDPDKIRFKLIQGEGREVEIAEALPQEPERTATLTGNSGRDYMLMKQLASIGNEWAIRSIADAANHCTPFDIDRLRQELENNNISYA